MSTVRRLWEREVLGGLLDHGMRGVDPLREELLRDVRGRVLEIGFGTGANLPFYPEGVEELVAVEPSEGFADRARQRLSAWGRPHELVVASASRALPLDASSFDAAVITFVLCSVPEIAPVLAEMRRLLRPGAPIFLAEHVLSPTPGARRALQRAIRPAWKAMLGGCDPARDTRSAIAAAGFDARALHERTLGLPFVVSTGLVGITRAQQ